MSEQTIHFAVQTKDNVVTRIGKSFITVPEVRFRGGEIKWFEDKIRDSSETQKEGVHVNYGKR